MNWLCKNIKEVTCDNKTLKLPILIIGSTRGKYQIYFPSSSRSLKENFTFFKIKTFSDFAITSSETKNRLQSAYSKNFLESDAANSTLLLTVWERRIIKKNSKRSLQQKTTQHPKTCLLLRIGHDIAILISCALPHVFVVCGAVCDSSHDMTISTWFLPFRISRSRFLFVARKVHEKLMRLHSMKM